MAMTLTLRFSYNQRCLCDYAEAFTSRVIRVRLEGTGVLEGNGGTEQAGPGEKPRGDRSDISAVVLLQGVMLGLITNGGWFLGQQSRTCLTS